MIKVKFFYAMFCFLMISGCYTTHDPIDSVIGKNIKNIKEDLLIYDGSFSNLSGDTPEVLGYEPSEKRKINQVYKVEKETQGRRYYLYWNFGKRCPFSVLVSWDGVVLDWRYEEGGPGAGCRIYH